ncbi:MAG: hypothetical protein ABIK79_10110 [Chloroflexota bacterium]|nr:hypothetical protein [Anaerolineae bacterium]
MKGTIGAPSTGILLWPTGTASSGLMVRVMLTSAASVSRASFRQAA